MAHTIDITECDHWAIPAHTRLLMMVWDSTNEDTEYADALLHKIICALGDPCYYAHARMDPVPLPMPRWLYVHNAFDPLACHRCYFMKADIETVEEIILEHKLTC